jgi:hypothetical protein
MSITLRSNAQALSDTLTMPTHSPGDLVIGIGTNDNAATIPTRPTGWTSLWAIGAGTSAIAAYYKYAQSTAETFGNWTNADHVSVTCWYGSPNTIVWPWFVQTGTGTSVTMAWPAQPAGTFRTASEDNVLLAYGHNRSTTNNLGQTLGAMTNLFTEGDGVNYQVAAKYQLARTTIWAATNLTMVTSVIYRTLLLCLTEQTGYGFSGGGGGGLILPRTFEGGYSA